MLRKTDYDDIVILGGCCEPVIANAKLRWSMTSYPFDFCLVRSVRTLATIIDSDFASYEDMSFQTIDLYPEQQMIRIGDSEIYIPHYYTLENSKADYKIKVESLRKLLASESRVLFVWKSHLYRNPKAEEFQILIETLERKAPRIDFDILVVNEYDTTEPIYDDYPDKCIVKNIIDDKSAIIYIPSQNITDVYMHNCECFAKELAFWSATLTN